MRAENDLSREIAILKNCKLEIEVLNKTNREAVRKFIGRNYYNDLNSVKTRYHYINNYNGFIASIQGEIIGHIWWWANNHNTNPPEEAIFYNAKLNNDEVYMFDFFIAPQYRGSGNALEFLTRVLLELKKLGFIRTIGASEPSNLPSRWIYRIVGEKDTRPLISHIFFNSIVYHDKAIFWKNWRQYFPFPSRTIVSLRNIFN